MRIAQKVIKLKLGLLKLAKPLENIFASSKSMGYSRGIYYRFLANYGLKNIFCFLIILPYI